MVIFCKWACLAAVPGILAAAAMAATADGSASGWLEVKGQRVELKYAFAAMSEDFLEGGENEKIEVLLSDKPVLPELRKATSAWSFWAGDQAQKGLLNGIIVYINADRKTWHRGQRLSKYGMEFYTQSSTSPEENNLVFTPASAGEGEIAGKVWMKKPMRAVDESEGPWRVQAEFRAPVIARPAVTERLTGLAARNSAPYKAVEAHFQACRTRNLEAIRKTLNANSLALLSKFEAERGKEAVLAMFAEEAAAPQKMKLDKVIVRGDTAEVIYASAVKGSKEEVTMRVVLENGVWKIGQ